MNKLIDVMTLNVAVMAWSLDFVWMSYRGTYMLTGSLPEDNHPKSAHIVRLGNN